MSNPLVTETWDEAIPNARWAPSTWPNRGQVLLIDGRLCFWWPTTTDAYYGHGSNGAGALWTIRPDSEGEVDIEIDWRFDDASGAAMVYLELYDETTGAQVFIELWSTGAVYGYINDSITGNYIEIDTSVSNPISGKIRITLVGETWYLNLNTGFGYQNILSLSNGGPVSNIGGMWLELAGEREPPYPDIPSFISYDNLSIYAGDLTGWDYVPIAHPTGYGIKVALSGIDITAKVSSLQLTADIGSICREVQLDFTDPDFFDTIDLATIPASPTLEVLTKTGTDWVSQGHFFLERPTYQIGAHQTDTGIWGRSVTARLTEPFAPKVSKIWIKDTTFYAICAELCALCELPWGGQAYSELADFTVYAYTFQAESQYPAKIIQDLIQKAVGDDGFLTADRAGNVCVKLSSRFPASSTLDLADAVISEIKEDPEWPEFANRIKISPSDTFSSFQVELKTDKGCACGNLSASVQLTAIVTDAEGNQVNGYPVNWSLNSSKMTLAHQVSTTGVFLVENETKKATGYFTIPTEMIPSEIMSIYAYSDKSKKTNYKSIATFSGKEITLSLPLTYCDQLMVVTYKANGIARNRAICAEGV